MTTQEKYQEALLAAKRKQQEPSKIERQEDKEVTGNNHLLETAKELVKEANEVKEVKVEKKEEPVIDSIEDDRYTYDQLGNKIRVLHNNTKRRKSIEGRVSKISIEEILIKGYVKQKVTINPGKLEVEFRSLSGDDIDFIYKKTFDQTMSAAQRSVKLSLFNLTASLERINDILLPDCRKNGELEDDLFKEKYNKIKKYPFEILSDLSINYAWFSERVQELSVDPENIINF